VTTEDAMARANSDPRTTYWRTVPFREVAHIQLAERLIMALHAAETLHEPSREKSLVITQIEQALQWLRTLDEMAVKAGL
jgi:hypothetical protein